MKTAIIDTEITGHHLEYVYGVYSQLAKQDHLGTTDLYCDNFLLEYIERNNLPEVQENYKLQIVTGRLKNPKGSWLIQAKTAYQNIQKLKNYDRIIFLSINVYFPALLLYALLNKPKFVFSGIYFNPYVRNGKNIKNLIKSFILRSLLRKYKNMCIFVLNDLNIVKELNRKFSTKVFKVLNDPIPDFYYDDIELTVTKRNNEQTFGLIGSISIHKGIFEFLKAVKVSKSNNLFIIAGKVDDSIVQEVVHAVEVLKEKGFDIELHNRFLSNREFAEFIAKIDVLVMPYLLKGASSGILGHAVYMNKLVIGPDQGLIAKLINEYSLGVTVDPKNENKFAQYLIDVRTIDVNIDKNKIIDYIENNSIPKFVSKLMGVFPMKQSDII